MTKKIISLALVSVLAFSMMGCGSQKKEEKKATEETTAVHSEVNSDDFKSFDVSTADWKMSVDNVQVAAELSNTSEVLGYSSASTSTFEQKAGEGNTYVLIKMTISKDGAKENITWDKMLLTDKDGNTYKRIDDTFLDDLTWTRISGTDLNFGDYEGWFAYEIPEDKAEEGLVLSYEFEDETMKYEIN